MDNDKDEKNARINERIAWVGFFLIVETILIGTLLVILFGH